jgi:hypothetical protein
MSSFSCRHFDVANDWCLLLKTDCVPGRKGCVVPKDTAFAIPAEERIRLKAEEKKATRPRGRARPPGAPAA